MGTSLKSKFQGHGLFANLSCLPHCRNYSIVMSIINCTGLLDLFYFFFLNNWTYFMKMLYFLGSDARTSPIVFLYCSDFISSHCSFFCADSRAQAWEGNCCIYMYISGIYSVWCGSWHDCT